MGCWLFTNASESAQVCLIREKYFKGQPFMQYKAKRTDSFILKAILQQQNLTRKGTRWEVRDGKSINFQHDNWVRNGSLGEFCLHQSILYKSLTIDQFFTPSLTQDIDSQSQFLPSNIIACIKAIPIPFYGLSQFPFMVYWMFWYGVCLPRKILL